MNMKQLYALLIILIVIYVGINVGANGLNILNSNDNSTGTTGGNSTGGITVGASSFAKIDGFTDTKINDTAVKLDDKNKNVTIIVQQIEDSTNLGDLYNSLLNGGTYTSGQQIDQNGVTAYFLYNESTDGYSADIYFAKNDHNYKISGSNITYENSDYFINSCKIIIDNLGGSSGDGKISRW